MRRVWWGEEGKEGAPPRWALGSAPFGLRLELCPVGSEEQVPPLALLPLEVGQEDKRPRRHRGGGCGGCGCGVWSKGLELDRLRHDAQLRPRYPCRDEALHVPPGRHPDLVCGTKAFGLFGRKVALGHRPRDHPERAIRCGPPAYAARLAVLDDDGGARLRCGPRTLVCPRPADRVGLLHGELAGEEGFVALAAEEAEAATRGQRQHEAQGDLDEEAREAAAHWNPPLDFEGKLPQDDIRRAASDAVVRAPGPPWCENDPPAAQPDYQQESEREQRTGVDHAAHCQRAAGCGSMAMLDILRLSSAPLDQELLVRVAGCAPNDVDITE